MNYRNLRVGNLIRDELGKIILKNLEFPGAIATLTEVDVDKRLDSAVIKVSVLPVTKTGAVLKELRKNVGKLQYLLSRQLEIRPMPKIQFLADRGPEKAAVVEKILLDK